MAENMKQIPFIDLAAQRKRMGSLIDTAVTNVLDHGQYIMGPEVAELETRLAAFSGAEYAVSCASGTDALALVLMALELKPGDAVYVPAFTFVASAEVVAWFGAQVVFVDVDRESFNICPESLKAAIGQSLGEGLRPRAIIAVDLFGQPADYSALHVIAREHDLFVLADAAQSFGAAQDNRRTGVLGHATTTSFFPAKPLGCYGDGGAVFTDDAAMYEVLCSLRNHGQGADRYDNIRIGMNGRLDTIQAAILLQKLTIFEDELVARHRVADRYSAALEDVADVPRLVTGNTSSWAQYTLRCADREAVKTACQEAGIPTAVYYPIPLNQQVAYCRFPVAPGGVTVSEMLSEAVISLPMHPYLDEEVQDHIIASVRAGLA